MKQHTPNRRGFTLIELLVVISIIGLLSSVVLASLQTARAKARDATRREELTQLRTALELYYNANGSYPATEAAGTAGTWYTSNSAGDPYTSNNSGNWIPGLVAAGNIGALPQDPLSGQLATNPVCSAAGWHRSFLYQSDGMDYKLLSHCAPEGTWTSNDSFYDPASRPTWAWMVTNNPTLPSGGCPANFIDATNPSYPACW